MSRPHDAINYKHCMRDLPSIYYRIILIISYLALLWLVEHSWLDKQNILTQAPLPYWCGQAYNGSFRHDVLVLPKRAY